MIDEAIEKQADRQELVERLAARWLAMKRQADGLPADARKIRAVIRVNPQLHDRTLRDTELFLRAYEEVRREMDSGRAPGRELSA